MKPKSYLVNGLIIVIPTLLIGVIGYAIGHLYLGDYNPPWTHHTIHPTPMESINIVHVDIQSSLEDPTGDILIVETQSGAVYSNTLFQNEWLLVDPILNWDNRGISTCAPVWPSPTDAHMWDPPPVEKEVIDSAGVRFERPISIIARCYVLLDDGSLEVWVHSGNGMELLGYEIYKMKMPLCGGIIGIVLGVTIVLFRKKHE